MSEDYDATKLKEAVAESGLKIKHLAKAIRVDPSTLSSFLNGKRSMNQSAQKLLVMELKRDPEAFKKKAS